MPPVLKFVVRGQEQTHEIVKDEVVVGRSTECDIQIPENSVSRKHARIFRDGDQWRVTDLGSSNGTFVDGQRLTPDVPSLVRDRGDLRFGTYRAFFLTSKTLHKLIQRMQGSE